MKKARWIALAVVIIVVAAGLCAYFTPALSVRSITVKGNSAVSADEIRRTANVATGTPLLQVDTTSVAHRVAQIRRLSKVTVGRSYPSKLTITVTERQPLLWISQDGKQQLLDDTGFSLADQAPPKGIPQLVTIDPGPSDAATLAAITVITHLPAWLRERVVTISAPSPVGITLTLASKKTVVWGDAENNEAKAHAAELVLTQPGTEFNVSAPEHPSYR